MNTTIARRTFYFLLILVLILVVFLFLGIAIVEVTPITNWSIDETIDIKAEILWQKKVPFLTTGFTPHAAIAASEHSLIFHSSSLGMNGNIIALNLITGDEQWRVRANSVQQVVAFDEGYLAVVGDSSVIRLDYSGNLIWQSDEFLSRSVRFVFSRDDLIYAPFRTARDSGLHVLSIETGQTIETIADENLISMYDDLVIKHSSNQIEVTSLSNNRIVWTTEIPYADYIPDYFDIEKIDNILLVYFGTRHIRAFDIPTGTMLWSMERKSGSYPLLVEDKLFVYSLDHWLEMYNPFNGELIGKIKLIRGNKETPLSVAMAAHGDIVALVNRDTKELVTLRIGSDD